MLGPWENGIGQDVRSDDAMAQRCQFNGLFTLNRTMGEEPGQLDVDLTILDYLLFKSTESMLNARIAELDETVMPNRESPEIKIEMTHAWLNFIHKHHGADALPPQTRFRAHLLQFTTVFTRRLHRHANFTTASSLAHARAQNRALTAPHSAYRARSPTLRAPFDPHREFPLPPHAQHAHRLAAAAALRVPDPDLDAWARRYYGTPACPSLHDLLPPFMRLTAARCTAGDDWVVAPKWQTLAGEWMLQAAVEGYLAGGASGPGLLEEAFAYGCPGLRRDGGDEEDEGVEVLRALFCREEEPRVQIQEWRTTRRDFIDYLLPEPGSSTSFVEAMEIASRDYPVAGFERNVLGFLTALHSEMPKPDLVQVEEGCIEGVSPEESREMLARMGL